MQSNEIYTHQCRCIASACGHVCACVCVYVHKCESKNVYIAQVISADCDVFVFVADFIFINIFLGNAFRVDFLC